MFRNRTSYSPPPNHLRRRYHAARGNQQSEGVSLSAHDSGFDGRDGLDLSIHHPSRSTGNRFDVLRPRSPPSRRNYDLHIPPYRRYRQTRGSKEAKKRRDARRYQRKMEAAQMLDAELSRGFGKTLDQANVRRPQYCEIPRPAPVLPMTTLPAPKPTHVPQTPPQLPYLNFGGLDLIGDIPQLTQSLPKSIAPYTPSLTPVLPSWCPALPSFVNNNTKWSDFPLFFDLSKLPEPVESPKPALKGRELQPWTPLVSPQPRKQSRFFPTSTPSKPTVRLPPISCKLHAADNGVQDAFPAKPKTLAESVEVAVKAAERANKSTCDQLWEASAANLWRILTSTERGDDNDLYRPYCAYQPAETVVAAPYGTYDHQLEAVGTPLELDGVQLPYVRANSLTGYANEYGCGRSPSAEEGNAISTSTGTTLAAQELPVGLNELVVDPYLDEGYADALLAVLNMPPQQSTSKPEDSAIFMPGFAPVSQGHENSEHDLARSDAQYKGEQALFNIPLPTKKGADEDLVDMAMGHSTNCWCNECGEPPELISNETLTEDDGWMVYSTVDETRSSSVSSAWEWEWGTIVTDDKRDIARRLCSGLAEWQESFPCTPSSVAHGPW